MQDISLPEKYKKLTGYISNMGSLAVAFSSGADSTFLLKAAKEALGSSVLAVTIKSCFFPSGEMEEAAGFCKQEGIKHIIIDIDQLGIDGLKENPEDRCYLCKKYIFGKIREAARENGISNIAEGSNLDDEGDYRPGLKAVDELGIKSPLRYAGFTKREIRALSGQMGLPTWNKPSFACYASRFVYGETITREKIGMVAKAEKLLHDNGFNQVRVRIHGLMARIEILPGGFPKLIQENIRETVVHELEKMGFTYVTMDLSGYHTGSMNKIL